MHLSGHSQWIFLYLLRIYRINYGFFLNPQNFVSKSIKAHIVPDFVSWVVIIRVSMWNSAILLVEYRELTHKIKFLTFQLVSVSNMKH